MATKLIFLDVETTGVDCPASGLIQLAGLIEIDGAIADKFDFHIQPFPDDAISDEALAVSGAKREDLVGYELPRDAFSKLLTVLDKYIDRYDRKDKFHLLAYNAKFDADHLRAWFEKNDDKYYGSWFWHPPIDVMGLAAAELMDNRQSLANFKLPTVANAIGVAFDEGKAHEALYDAEVTREIFLKLRKPVG